MRAPAPYWIFLLVYPGQSGARAGRTSGPFKLTRFGPDRVVIERDPNYQGGVQGNVRAVEWVAKGTVEAIGALVAKEIDLSTPLTPPATVIDAIAGGELVNFASAPLVSLFIAFSGSPSNQVDVDLRKALAHAVDRQALEAYRLSNHLRASGGLVPPGLPGHTPGTALPFNPELARDYRQRSEHRGSHSRAQQLAAPLLIVSIIVLRSRPAL